MIIIAATLGALVAATAVAWPTGVTATARESVAPGATAPAHPGLVGGALASRSATAYRAHRSTTERHDARLQRRDATGRWTAPVDGLDVVTGFDPPPLPWLPGHRGVDLAAAPGDPVRAAGAGTVIYAGDLAGRGVVSIQHPIGLRTTYEPVEPVVARGEEVAGGQVIGTLAAGHASCPGRTCLHFGLKRGPLYLDPMLLFGAGKVRLLPRPTATVRAQSAAPGPALSLRPHTKRIDH
jgi:murein DD-endopeptidase MepM/ murein hydrolase activator NlpD